ncbi:anthranilate N-benzoyltransferase protein 1-like [Chenopodium quinoa]|uniref:anthranilate N-benzoyltransferase protein 1-like n=1 Tax=Chenopodium quinoa TaxID=63459 RepID=UPI000B79961C|nr:anthranilate N-benzoyltransferase protein 1-like [Chenopodium quinoa]
MNGVDEIVIDCNAKGALFIYAETTHKLTDLEEGKPNYGELRKMVIPTCDYSKGLSSFPLFMVQFTRFECGGVAMGVASHHHVADGIAHTYIINYFLRFIQGRDIPVAPVFDRSAVRQLAPRNPPQVKFRHLEYEPSLPPLPPNSSTGFEPISTMHLHSALPLELIGF